MNKKEFIDKLVGEMGYSEEKANQINEILEDHFLIGKNNKEKMITAFMEKLNVDNNEAENIYDTAMGILGEEVMEKIKHPFRNQDK